MADDEHVGAHALAVAPVGPGGAAAVRARRRGPRGGGRAPVPRRPPRVELPRRRGDLLLPRAATRRDAARRRRGGAVGGAARGRLHGRGRARRRARGADTPALVELLAHSGDVSGRSSLGDALHARALPARALPPRLVGPADPHVARARSPVRRARHLRRGAAAHARRRVARAPATGARRRRPHRRRGTGHQRRDATAVRARQCAARLQPSRRTPASWSWSSCARPCWPAGASTTSPTRRGRRPGGGPSRAPRSRWPRTGRLGAGHRRPTSVLAPRHGLRVAWGFAQPPAPGVAAGSFARVVAIVHWQALLEWLVVAGAALALLTLRLAGRLGPTAFASAAVALVAADLLKAGIGLNPAIPDAHAVQPVTPALRVLQERRPNRFVGLGPTAPFSAADRSRRTSRCGTVCGRPRIRLPGRRPLSSPLAQPDRPRLLTAVLHDRRLCDAAGAPGAQPVERQRPPSAATRTRPAHALPASRLRRARRPDLPQRRCLAAGIRSQKPSRGLRGRPALRAVTAPAFGPGARP